MGSLSITYPTQVDAFVLQCMYFICMLACVRVMYRMCDFICYLVGVMNVDDDKTTVAAFRLAWKFECSLL